MTSRRLHLVRRRSATAVGRINAQPALRFSWISLTPRGRTARGKAAGTACGDRRRGLPPTACRSASDRIGAARRVHQGIRSLQPCGDGRYGRRIHRGRGGGAPVAWSWSRSDVEALGRGSANARLPWRISERWRRSGRASTSIGSWTTRCCRWRSKTPISGAQRLARDSAQEAALAFGAAVEPRDARRTGPVAAKRPRTGRVRRCLKFRSCRRRTSPSPAMPR